MKNKNRPVVRALSLILQLGITMMVPIFLCLFVGSWLDKKLNTNFLVILFLILGMLAGFRNAYYSVKSFLKEEDKSETK
ncbi:AtpZ/AtpI family protein [Anaerolentibacter hominis]|uniref:AtpZ/AtpI family protein n=1 Tax=Anaerolentibacter hominis TaxID=3079009 RepID=UPI0031B87319